MQESEGSHEGKEIERCSAPIKRTVLCTYKEDGALHLNSTAEDVSSEITVEIF